MRPLPCNSGSRGLIHSQDQAPGLIQVGLQIASDTRLLRTGTSAPIAVTPRTAGRKHSSVPEHLGGHHD